MKQLPAEGNEEQTDISGERDGYTYMRQLPVQNQQQTEESNSLLPEGSDADDLDYSHAYIGRPQGDSSDHLECNYSYTGRNLGQDSNAANTTDDTDQSYSYVGKLQGDSSDNQANNYYYTERRPGQGGDTADDMDYNSRYVGNQPGDNNGDMNYYSYPEGAPVGGSEHMPYYSYPDGTQVVGNSDNLISTTQNSAYSNRIITSTNQGLPGYDHNSTVHLYEPTPTRPLPPPPPGNSESLEYSYIFMQSYTTPGNLTITFCSNTATTCILATIPWRGEIAYCAKHLIHVFLLDPDGEHVCTQWVATSFTCSAETSTDQ